MVDVVTSAANPVVKRMRALALRKHRRRENAAVVYGIQPVTQAVEAGSRVEVVAHAPELLRNAGAQAMVERLRRAGTRTVAVDAGLLVRLGGRDGPGGLAAIVETRYTSPHDVHLGLDAVVVALDHVGNPGNLGTIMRTADATGAAAVLLIGHAADPYDPAAIKASMGAVFQLPIVRLEGVAEFFRWATDQDLPIVTTAARADSELWATVLPARLAVLMGSEGDGLTDASLAGGTIRLAIPMKGSTESLNLAAATGIVLYEVWRQRAING